MKYRITIIACLFFATNLQAQEKQFSDKYYIGLGYATTTVDITPIEINALHPDEGGNPAQVDTINKSTGGARLYGGWRILKNLALEIAFTDVGRISYTGTVPADNGTYTENVSMNSGSATFNATIPLSDTQHLLLKAGAHTTISTSTYQYAGDTSNYSTSSTSRNDGALIGVGYEYLFPKNIGIRVEWEKSFGMIGPNAWDAGFVNIAFVYNYND